MYASGLASRLTARLPETGIRTLPTPIPDEINLILFGSRMSSHRAGATSPVVPFRTCQAAAQPLRLLVR